jgi:hypothetical protein
MLTPLGLGMSGPAPPIRYPPVEQLQGDGTIWMMLQISLLMNVHTIDGSTWDTFQLNKNGTVEVWLATVPYSATTHADSVVADDDLQ